MKKYNPEKLTISNNDKMMLVSNLSPLLSAGIPIFESINTLKEESKENVKYFLDEVSDDMIQGKTLSDAFRKFPNVFSNININILKASEHAGNLEEALNDLKISVRRDIEFRDKIKGALLYPMVLLVVFFVVVLVILFVAIPKIATVFSNLRVELPLPTRILIFVSNALTTYTIPILAAVVLIIVALVYLYKNNKKRFLLALSSLPILSRLFQEIDITVFSRNLALLLNSGVAITTALELTQDVVLSKNVGKAIEDARVEVHSGGRMSEGFRKNKNAFPGVMVKIVEAGEKSGRLDSAMQDVSDYMDYNVSMNLKTTTALLEPAILVIVGIFMGGVMISIIAPIYNLISHIQVN